MRLLTVFIMLVFSTSCFSQADDLSDRLVEFIASTTKIGVMNPTHKEATDIINKSFIEALTGKYSNNISKDERRLNCLKLIYKNGDSWYEDSLEERRLNQRRSLCFATIALLSDEWKSGTFIYYSKCALVADIENPDLILKEEPYLGIMFLDIYLRNRAGYLTNGDLLKLDTFIKENKDYLREEVILEANILLGEYKKKL
jgi:hypothetical protein